MPPHMDTRVPPGNPGSLAGIERGLVQFFWRDILLFFILLVLFEVKILQLLFTWTRDLLDRLQLHTGNLVSGEPLPCLALQVVTHLCYSDFQDIMGAIDRMDGEHRLLSFHASH